MCGLARALAEAGHRVVIASGASTPTSLVNLGEGEAEGLIRYMGVGELPTPNDSLVTKLVQVLSLWGRKTARWLDAQEVRPSHVIVYGGSAQYVLNLLPWCRKNDVPLIIDVVEWYDPRQLTGGRFGPFYISAQLALRLLYPKSDGIVAISQFLAEHYARRGCRVIRIPPILDVRNITTRNAGIAATPAQRTKMRLVYAGTPGKKDLLANVVQAVSAVDPDGNDLELLILGPSEEEVKKLLGPSQLPTSVTVLGRVAQPDVASYVREADFTVLLREPATFSNAGFPTKFVESMANGTPVIANLTGDLGLYLHDETNGLVCSDYSVGALSETLRRALLLTPGERGSMREAARRQAEQSFDFRAYGSQLSSFLEIPDPKRRANA
jgi:glycosyltransferase involved in cell wall biosynthesis